MITIDDKNMALNDTGGETTTPVTTPVAEQKTVEEVAPNKEASLDGSAETTGGQRKGYRARVQELDQRAKAAEEKARSLEDKIAELTAPVNYRGPVQTPQYDPQKPVVAPGEEIDVNELNRRISERETRILQSANSQSELRLRQEQAIARHSSEAAEMTRTYPELDPNSDNFNPELSDSITEATDAYLRQNPYSGSVKTFVTKLMKPYQGAVTREVGQARENIARQVSQAALRPTAIRKEEKDAREKSIKELEADLGIIQT